MFLGNCFDRCKFVNSRVINQDIRPPVVFDGRVDDTLRFCSLGNDPDNGLRRSEWHQRVLALVATGHSYRQVGRLLNISKNTVLDIVKRATQPNHLNVGAV